MSLHRYLAPPPLALAVHPAPALKSREERKLEEAEKERAKAEAKDKAKEKAAAQEAAKGEQKPTGEAGDGESKGDGQDGAARDGKDDKAAKLDKTPQLQKSGKDLKVAVGGNNGVLAPTNPVENDPSPPGKVVAGAQPVPAANDVQSAKSGADPRAGHAAGAKPAVEAAKDTGPAPAQPKPLRLLIPVPLRPLRARLDLDPTRPYPPVYTDPRGAYHKYAKALQQTNDVYIDVTKDGWLAPQWKERAEREALARLTGEADKEVERAVKGETEHGKGGGKKVPESAGEMVLELWNALVDTPSHEVSQISQRHRNRERYKLMADSRGGVLGPIRLVGARGAKTSAACASRGQSASGARRDGLRQRQEQE
jgi:hypothetical protein